MECKSEGFGDLLLEAIIEGLKNKESKQSDFIIGCTQTLTNAVMTGKLGPDFETFELEHKGYAEALVLAGLLDKHEIP